MTLRCDCGYLAQGDDPQEFVTAALAHAMAVHHVELTPELVLNLEEGSNQGALRLVWPSETGN